MLFESLKLPLGLRIFLGFRILFELLYSRGSTKMICCKFADPTLLFLQTWAMCFKEAESVAISFCRWLGDFGLRFLLETCRLHLLLQCFLYTFLTKVHWWKLSFLVYGSCGWSKMLDSPKIITFLFGTNWVLSLLPRFMDTIGTSLWLLYVGIGMRCHIDFAVFLSLFCAFCLFA